MCLFSQVAAIDGVVSAGDERGFVGAEPADQLGHFCGPAQAADEVQRHQPGFGFGRKAAQQRGFDIAGAYRINANACVAYSMAAVWVRPTMPCLPAT